MKRRMIALVLTTALMGSMVSGCGAADTAQEKTVDEETETGQTNGVFTGELEKNVTIQVLENDTAISKGYFKELIEAFNEAYKDEGIQAVDANMDQYLDLANDGPYGYGPDVLYQANDVIMQYAKGKHIYPLPVQQLSCYEQIPESAWKAYETTVDGTTYCCGVPVNVQAPMLYYRADLLPEDWQDHCVAEETGQWLSLYSKENQDAGYGGLLCSIGWTDDPESYAGIPGCQLLGRVTIDGVTYDVVADVIDDPQAPASGQLREQYLAMQQELPSVFQSLQFGDGVVYTPAA